MICVYEGTATDYTTLGLGVLRPSACTISEEAEGSLTLNVTQPITDDKKYQLLQVGRIIRAPMPVAQTPVAAYVNGTDTVYYPIYRCDVSVGLSVRDSVGASSSRIAGLAYGDEVIKLADAGTYDGNYWYQIQIGRDGLVGYVAAGTTGDDKYLVYVRTDSEVVAGDATSLDIYEIITTKRLRLNESIGGAKIASYAAGTEIAQLENLGETDGATWWRVLVLSDGATGYMCAREYDTDYVKYLRTETDYVDSGGANTSVDSGGANTSVDLTLARDQLFRIVSVTADAKALTITAKARHIFYDLQGVVVLNEYAPEEISAKAVCGNLLLNADRDIGFNIFCACTDSITADYTGRNIVDCLLNPDDGVVALCSARIYRDNRNVYIIPTNDGTSEVELRRGKNLTSASSSVDVSGVVTRIYPVGKTADGSRLVGDYVDAPNAEDYSEVVAKCVSYDVQVGDELTEEEALAKLAELAQADFDEGVGAADEQIKAAFVRMDQAELFGAQYATESVLHLYDRTAIRDNLLGLDALMELRGYTWDCLRERYTSTTFETKGKKSARIANSRNSTELVAQLLSGLW